jgi:hypothetical protein
MEDNKRLVTVHIAVGWLRERAERDRKLTGNLVLLFNFYPMRSRRRQAHTTIAAIAMGRISW